MGNTLLNKLVIEGKLAIKDMPMKCPLRPDTIMRNICRKRMLRPVNPSHPLLMLIVLRRSLLWPAMRYMIKVSITWH